MNVGALGRIAAVVLFVVVVAIVYFVSTAGQGTSGNGQNAANTSDLGPIPELPDTAQVSVNNGDPVSLIELGESAFIDSVDDQTGQLEYRLVWDSLDPLEGGRFLVRAPRATFYGSGSRTEITADEAVIFWPDRDVRTPESGVLRGSVSIRVFPQFAAPGKESDTQADSLRVTTKQLRFETALGQLQTQDAINISAPGLAFSGRGLTLRFSEQRKRLQYGRVDQGGELIVDPTKLKPITAPTQNANTSTTSSDHIEIPFDPQIDFYRVRLNEDTVLKQGPRTVKADEIELFFRLIEGSLATGAVNSLAALNGGQQADEPTPSPNASSSNTNDNRIELAWDGELVVRPLEQQPEELTSEEIAARVHSPDRTGIVQINDNASSLELRCVRLDYGLTTGKLAVVGRTDTGMLATVPGKWIATPSTLLVDLPTGTGEAPGPGTIRSDSARSANPAAGETQIMWQRGVQFALTNTPGGGVVPQTVVFDEAVKATSPQGEARADKLSAFFEPATGALAKLELNGAASLAMRRTENNADQGPNQSAGQGMDTARADTLTVHFDTTAQSLTPTQGIARGSVLFDTAQGKVQADAVESEFFTNDQGQLAARRILASGDVIASDTQGISITGDRVDHDPIRQVTHLSGEPASITAQSDAGQRTMTGESIVFAQQSRQLTVFGPGTAQAKQHVAPTQETRATTNPTQAAADPENTQAEPLVYSHVKLRWSGSMTYDDLSGEAEMQGGVIAEGLLRDQQWHKAQGDRLVVSLSPWSDVASERTVVGFRLEALSQVEAGPPITRVESRFVDPQAGQSKPSLVALQGPEIIGEGETQSLRVPGAGTLVLDDQRASNARTSEAVDQNAAGTSVFTWENGLLYNRLSGVASMTGSVNMKHRQTGSGVITTLECEALRATFMQPASGETLENAQDPKLMRVEAEQGVYIRHADIEIVADRLVYDAQTGKAVAQADSSNTVTIHDAAKGQHMSAKAVEIDLITSRWRVLNVSGRTSIRTR